MRRLSMDVMSSGVNSARSSEADEYSPWGLGGAALGAGIERGALLGRDPGCCGSFSRRARPVAVSGLGEAWTVAPYIRMNCRRCVFQSWTARTQKMVVGRPARLAAYANAVPHCPAPVSVVRRSYPSRFAYHACASAVFTLWLPVGL